MTGARLRAKPGAGAPQSREGEGAKRGNDRAGDRWFNGSPLLSVRSVANLPALISPGHAEETKNAIILRAIGRNAGCIAGFVIVIRVIEGRDGSPALVGWHSSGSGAGGRVAVVAGRDRRREHGRG